MTVIAQDTTRKHACGKILWRSWQIRGLGQHLKQKEGHTHLLCKDKQSTCIDNELDLYVHMCNRQWCVYASVNAAEDFKWMVCTWKWSYSTCRTHTVSELVCWRQMCTQRNISELVHSAVSVQTGKYAKYIKYKSKSNYTAYLLIINPACLDLKENSTPGLSKAITVLWYSAH